MGESKEGQKLFLANEPVIHSRTLHHRSLSTLRTSEDQKLGKNTSLAALNEWPRAAEQCMEQQYIVKRECRVQESFKFSLSLSAVFFLSFILWDIFKSTFLYIHLCLANIP